MTFVFPTYVGVCDRVLKQGILPQIFIKCLHSTHSSSQWCMFHHVHFVRWKKLESGSVVVLVRNMDSYLKLFYKAVTIY